MTAVSAAAGGVPVLHLVPSDHAPETAAFQVTVAACVIPVSPASQIHINAKKNRILI